MAGGTATGPLPSPPRLSPSSRRLEWPAAVRPSIPPLWRTRGRLPHRHSPAGEERGPPQLRQPPIKNARFTPNWRLGTGTEDKMASHPRHQALAIGYGVGVIRRPSFAGLATHTELRMDKVNLLAYWFEHLHYRRLTHLIINFVFNTYY